MAITEQLEESGRWLFRWRGYLPVVMVILALVAEVAEFADFSAVRSWLPVVGWEFSCLVLSAFGMAVRVAAIGHTPAGTSGRNAREQRAAALNTTGVYSLVRHPLYLGNFFLMLGVVVFARSLWLTVWYVLSFWLYYERIMAAEEAFLRQTFGDGFELWARSVPAFVPRLSGWVPAALGFSLKNVLRREYNGFFAVFVAMFALDVARNASRSGRFEADRRWLVMLGVSMAFWIVLRSLKRHTSALRVEGR